MSEIYQRNKKLEDGRINGKWEFEQDSESGRWCWKEKYLSGAVRRRSNFLFLHIQDAINDAYENGYPKRSADLNFPVGNRYLVELEVVESGDFKLLDKAEFKVNYLAPLVKNKTNKKGSLNI